jgi:hypothetical protein
MIWPMSGSLAQVAEVATAIAMLSVDCYLCMGCQSCEASGGYFDTWKAAACHYARSKQCQQTGRVIKYIQIQSMPGDRDAGGSGAAGPWEQQRPSF